MDYKYIEQLLQRYWDCETTLEEEQILRSFFAQGNPPASLTQYAPLFALEKAESQLTLSADFEARLEAAIAAEERPAATLHRTKARVVSLRSRLSAFAKAAAVVAMLLTVGNAAERATSVQSSQPSSAPAVALENTYVRSSDVPAILAPALQRKEATATAQTSADSLAAAKTTTGIAPEIEVAAEK
jgi:hypothetical protein